MVGPSADLGVSIPACPCHFLWRWVSPFCPPCAYAIFLILLSGGGARVSSGGLLKGLSDDRLFSSAVRHLTLGGWDARGYLVKGCAFDDRVLCPSVYSSSKWVLRALTPKELAAIYHVPTVLHQEVDGLCGFHQAAPGLLLKYVWEDFVKSLSPSSSSDGISISSGPSSTVGELELGSDEQFPTISDVNVISSTSSVKSFDFSIAVKADDAEIPTFIWDDRVWGLELHSDQQKERLIARFSGRNPLTVIREFLLITWRKHLTRSFIHYMRTCHGRDWASSKRAEKERDAGKDCLRRSALADWWEWKDGSSLFFWRWPPYARSLALLGHKPWFAAAPPNYRVPQRPEGNDETRQRIKTKLEVPLNRRCIYEGRVDSLTSFFSVPKGETDLRMVYDASKSGLNNSLWVPSFQLPTCETLTDLLSPNSWMGDLDLGEHFHNFPLHEELQVYCGIDLRPYFPSAEARKTVWRRWSRCMMGLKPSPYFTIKATHLAYEVSNGDWHDPRNALQWDTVVLNLPGSDDYTPTHPWVYRITKSGDMAGSTPAYVDDLRPVGSTAEHCFQVAHQTGSRLGYLGIHNASRKTRPPSQKPWAWAGIIAKTDGTTITVCTSQENGKRLSVSWLRYERKSSKLGIWTTRVLNRNVVFLCICRESIPP
jgi:hypothetical protein